MRAAGHAYLLVIVLMLIACKATVRAELSEAEANQIVAALDQTAIAATKVAESGTASDRYRVEVGTADVTRAILVLEARQLPKPPEPGFEVLYREPASLVATPEEERARWTAATAGELSRSLERLEGVLDARVHLALPEASRSLDDERPLPKASVLIRRRHQAPPVDESAVRALIAGAVQGLSGEHVTIVQAEGPSTAISRPALTRFGPVTVTRQSLGPLKLCLAVALGLDLVMAAGLVALVYARRRKSVA